MIVIFEYIFIQVMTLYYDKSKVSEQFRPSNADSLLSVLSLNIMAYVLHGFSAARYKALML